jgi:hypothetical protein
MTTIVDTLQAAGIDAYLPGRAPGECRKAHAVVDDGGRVREGRTTGRRIYYVTAYVPEARPGDLAGFVARISDALAPLKTPRCTGNVSDEFFDDEKKARGATVELSALCTL